MYKASNAVKISNKEANKAEISNEALETDSSVYIVKSIKKRARNIIDLNEGEQYERANNKDRNGVNTEIQNVNYESAGAAALSVLPTVKLESSRADVDLHSQWKKFKSRSLDKGKLRIRVYYSVAFLTGLTKKENPVMKITRIMRKIKTSTLIMNVKTIVLKSAVTRTTEATAFYPQV